LIGNNKKIVLNQQSQRNKRKLSQEKSDWVKENQNYLIVIGIFSEITLLSLVLYVISGANKVLYDLSIGIFVSAIFTILTIVFLTWLIQAREEKVWKIVKELAFKRIEEVINDLGADICFIIPSLLSIYQKTLKQEKAAIEQGIQKDETIFFESLKQKMQSLSESDLLLWSSLNDKNVKEKFSDFKYEIDSIIDTYFRFFSPNLIESLIKVRNSVRAVEQSIQQELISESSTEYEALKTKKEIEKWIQSFLNSCKISFTHIAEELPKIIEEINKITETHFI